jgi:cell division protein FtsI/penicillin-binding protein 2
MASYPSFDPNNYTSATQDELNTNAASFVYEPGSTFKPIVMAGALDGGYIAPNFTYNDTGSINVNGTIIHNWDSTNYGTSNLQDIILRSSNVGMTNISRQMTSKQMMDAIKKAGVGQKTGIELPNEETGLIPTPKQLDNDPVRKANVSFGQGISVTPLRVITSFSQIINGGYKITPTILENVQDQYGNTQYQWQQPKQQKIYKDTTVALMKSYLKANLEIGSGKGYGIPGYDGGAKTGSAWFVENGKYASGKIIGSFIGFIPYNHPKYAMLAVVDDPKNVALFGSNSSGPLFNGAMTEILRYKGEPHTVPLKGQKTIEKEKEINISDMTYELFDVAKAKIEKEVNGNVNVIKNGTGEVVLGQDYTYKNNSLVVTLKTSNIKGTDNNTYIPNLEGLPKDKVTALLEKYNIKAEFHGNGIVKYQETNPGEYSNKINKIVFWCE